jgi:hypothetical protein
MQRAVALFEFRVILGWHAAFLNPLRAPNFEFGSNLWTTFWWYETCVTTACAALLFDRWHGTVASNPFETDQLLVLYLSS